eukprot:scaffold192079_cov26-Cyclotella_meneghiniana.AAC.1
MREDPYQQLIDASDWRVNEQAINNTLAAFSEIAPDISKYKVNAAMDLRLAELNEYKQNYQQNAPFSESIYTTL